MSQAITTANDHSAATVDQLDTFTVGSRTFSSRLLVGTGKYKDLTQTGEAITASEAEIVTVAIRRTNIGQNSNEPNLLEVISPDKYTILPNTAGCFDADSAVRTCKLARELLGGHNLVKLEVLGDEKSLYPNVTETLKAAKVLIDDGFEVMVYTSDDPIVAQELESMGCVAIMPLGSLIGSGLGLLNRHTLSLIIENANVPVLVDADIVCYRTSFKAQSDDFSLEELHDEIDDMIDNISVSNTFGGDLDDLRCRYSDGAWL